MSTETEFKACEYHTNLISGGIIDPDADTAGEALLMALTTAEKKVEIQASADYLTAAKLNSWYTEATEYDANKTTINNAISAATTWISAN
jgi:acyl-coenzyme A thioesterase PaaI-like protein